VAPAAAAAAAAAAGMGAAGLQTLGGGGRGCDQIKQVSKWVRMSWQP